MEHDRQLPLSHLAHLVMLKHIKIGNFSFYKSNGTGCTPCFTGMKYNSATKKCECIDSTYV